MAVSRRMLKAYRQMPDINKNMWLTTNFKTGPGDITNAQEIEIDIERGDEDIAPVLTDISTGAHVISNDIYTGKVFTPPSMAIKTPFNVFDLIQKQAGQTVYEAANVAFQALLRTKMFDSWAKMQNMIKRTIELQASQILQTGKFTLYDKNGNARYIMDFKPKNSHFPNAAVKWATVATADPLDDMEALAEVVRNDGFVDIRHAIMADDSFNYFLQNAKVQKYFDKTGFNLGALAPQMLNNGATLQGQVSVGNYKFIIWTYGGRYNSLATSTKTKYIGTGKVVLLPDQGDLDFRKVFGAIPTVINSDPRFQDILPSRVSVPGAFDFKPRVFTDENAETMYSEIKSRPLLIPVSIDRYGCINTEF